jgi:hypothetical protein
MEPNFTPLPHILESAVLMSHSRCMAMRISQKSAARCNYPFYNIAVAPTTKPGQRIEV